MNCYKSSSPTNEDTNAIPNETRKKTNKTVRQQPEETKATSSTLERPKKTTITKVNTKTATIPENRFSESQIEFKRNDKTLSPSPNNHEQSLKIKSQPNENPIEPQMKLGKKNSIVKRVPKIEEDTISEETRKSNSPQLHSTSSVFACSWQ